MMLAPDELQRDIYRTDIAPNIRDGAALLSPTASTSTSA